MDKIFVTNIVLYTTFNIKDTDALSVFGNKIHYQVLRDRFGYLNQFSNWNLSADVEKFPESNKTYLFSDLMDKRAEEILWRVRSENKELYIFLSGGVDSTAMTIAIIKVADGDYRNIHIVYTQTSIDENKNFIEYLKTINIDLKLIVSYELTEFQNNLLSNNSNFILTGWCADQLFGSAVNQEYPDWYFKDWKMWIKYIILLI